MSVEDATKRFTKVYNEENDSIFRFCLLRVSDREQALDLTQESFTRLWQALVADKQVQNPRAFLFVVARHLIIDWYRKSKSVSLDALLEREDGSSFEVPDAKGVVELELATDAKRVVALFDSLEPKYRDVLYMRYVEDLPPKEIAQILKLPANVVSVRITRGVKALRREMGWEDNPET